MERDEPPSYESVIKKNIRPVEQQYIYVQGQSNKCHYCFPFSRVIIAIIIIIIVAVVLAVLFIVIFKNDEITCNTRASNGTNLFKYI
jgi:hypothetical protein